MHIGTSECVLHTIFVSICTPHVCHAHFAFYSVGYGCTDTRRLEVPFDKHVPHFDSVYLWIVGTETAGAATAKAELCLNVFFHVKI